MRPEDFGDPADPLAGFRMQREIEQAARRAANGDTGTVLLSSEDSNTKERSSYANGVQPGYLAPAQRVEDFLRDRASRGFGEVQPSYRPGVVPADLREVLPDFIIRNLKLALPVLDRQLRGFALPDAVLTGPETRSSSPVRLPREADGQAAGIAGLYPVGEGAGFAGGIVSAALDGIGAARKALEKNRA